MVAVSNIACKLTFLRRALQQHILASSCQMTGVSKFPARGFSNQREERVVKVAVIGDPNSGKSTLVNSILGRRVNSVSSKVHTTRRKSVAVLNVGNIQLVFVDTPGFVSHRSRIGQEVEKSLVLDAYASVEEVNVVVALHDASNFYSKYHFSREIAKALRLIPEGVGSVLALNKVDLLKDKTELLAVTKKLMKSPEKPRVRKRGLRDLFDAADGRAVSSIADTSDTSTSRRDEYQHAFDSVFMLSAKIGTGVDKLRDYLLSKAMPSPWLYDSGFVTDQSMEEMIRLCVKEKILDLTTEEIPYVVQPAVDLVHEDESGHLNILVSLHCSSRRIASSLMGSKGSTIRNIAVAAEQSLSEALEKPVLLKIVLKQQRKKMNG